MLSRAGPPFNVFEVPLAGINLIEASAGTGKTRTITDLYVRFILETTWQVPHILVVTFTNAATAELRDRVRQRLVDTRDAFLTQKTVDPYCQQWLMCYPQRQQAIQRLDRAIRGFDEAAISTIHAFCQRLLGEVAFECGMPFEAELLPDDSEILQEIIDDFWRRELYHAEPLLVQQFLDSTPDPGKFLETIHRHVGKPYLKIAQPSARQGTAPPRHADLFKVRLFEHCRQCFGDAKRRRALQSYDDLLLNLKRALDDHHGGNLAAAIRQRYPVALIDEFQDTDPVQYAIFRQVYGGTSLPVFYLGDPKQAIYGFRSADIFEYLRACRDAECRHTLQINWRANPNLIEAVNTLFRSARQPFLLEEIPFHPVQPAPGKHVTFTENGREVSQLRVWLLKGRRVKKPDATAAAARATAAEITRLMNLGQRGEARIGDRPLQGGDIAVLVRSNELGQCMREHLTRLGVASVQLGHANVFHAWEAQELERVLRAVADPTSEALLAGALATVMLGMPGEELVALTDSERAWEHHLEDFLDCHRLWREHGFARMFPTLLARRGVARRLLSFQDGERRLTNLRHLAELLQATATRQHTGMEELITWLAERRQSEAGKDEEEQLRLESDEQLVKIVTVHSSKGLEYPIVFCPFLWSGKFQMRKDRAIVFHDRKDDHRAVLDLGTERSVHTRIYARDEYLAEELRLLYVALTRAKHCCYMTWGSINDTTTSTLAWLLHQPQPSGHPLSIEELSSHVKGLTEAAIRSDLDRLARESNGAIRIEPLPSHADESYQPIAPMQTDLHARDFPWPLRHRWRVTSFSALALGDAEERPDYDALAQGPAQEMASDDTPSIFTFPRGRRAGSCLHAMLQRLDFAKADADALERCVWQVLGEYGFAESWTPIVAETLTRVVAAPLDAAGALHLKDAPLDRRLNELEFTYPLHRLTCEGLQRLLNTHGFSVGPVREDIGRLSFAPARGYMKGFIDLVFEANGRFYLVDYKSHWLGSTPEAYRQEALAAVMARDAYDLQYLIYTVAVHRYLQLRLPEYDYETHFGGVFYLFLRGMDQGLGPECGVFRDRPTQDLVVALDAYLATGSLRS